MLFGQCSICREIFDNSHDIAGLRCGHVYHRNCLIRALNANKVCPICRGYASHDLMIYKLFFVADDSPKNSDAASASSTATGTTFKYFATSAELSKKFDKLRAEYESVFKEKQTLDDQLLETKMTAQGNIDRLEKKLAKVENEHKVAMIELWGFRRNKPIIEENMKQTYGQSQHMAGLLNRCRQQLETTTNRMMDQERLLEVESQRNAELNARIYELTARLRECDSTKRASIDAPLFLDFYLCKNDVLRADKMPIAQQAATAAVYLDSARAFLNGDDGQSRGGFSGSYFLDRPPAPETIWNKFHGKPKQKHVQAAGDGSAIKPEAPALLPKNTIADVSTALTAAASGIATGWNPALMGQDSLFMDAPPEIFGKKFGADGRGATEDAPDTLVMPTNTIAAVSITSPARASGIRNSALVGQSQGSYFADSPALLATKTAAAGPRRQTELGTQLAAEAAFSFSLGNKSIVPSKPREGKLTSDRLQRGLTDSTLPPQHVGLAAPFTAVIPPVQTAANGSRADCVGLRGLPCDAKTQDVLEFLGVFAKYVVQPGVQMVYAAQGKLSGEAFVQLESEQVAFYCSDECNSKYMQIGNNPRRIEVFQCSSVEMNVALNLPSSVPAPILLAKPVLSPTANESFFLDDGIVAAAAAHRPQSAAVRSLEQQSDVVAAGSSSNAHSLAAGGALPAVRAEKNALRTNTPDAQYQICDNEEESLLIRQQRGV